MLMVEIFNQSQKLQMIKMYFNLFLKFGNCFYWLLLHVESSLYNWLKCIRVFLFGLNQRRFQDNYLLNPHTAWIQWFRNCPHVSSAFKQKKTRIHTQRIRIVFPLPHVNGKRDGNTIASLIEHASCKKHMMYDIIVFENLRLRRPHANE